jgi:hypothetical protein
MQSRKVIQMKWLCAGMAMLSVLCIGLFKTPTAAIKVLPVTETVSSQGRFYYETERDSERACLSERCRAAKPKSELAPLLALEKVNAIIGQNCLERCQLILSWGKVIWLSGTPIHVVKNDLLVVQYDLGFPDYNAIYPNIFAIQLQSGQIRSVKYDFYFRNAKQKCFDIGDFWLDIANFGERFDDQNIYFLRQDKCGLFNHIVAWR